MEIDSNLNLLRASLYRPTTTRDEYNNDVEDEIKANKDKYKLPQKYIITPRGARPLHPPLYPNIKTV